MLSLSVSLSTKISRLVISHIPSDSSHDVHFLQVLLGERVRFLDLGDHLFPFFIVSTHQHLSTLRAKGVQLVVLVGIIFIPKFHHISNQISVDLSVSPDPDRCEEDLR